MSNADTLPESVTDLIEWDWTSDATEISARIACSTQLPDEVRVHKMQPEDGDATFTVTITDVESDWTSATLSLDQAKALHYALGNMLGRMRVTRIPATGSEKAAAIIDAGRRQRQEECGPD